MTNNPDRRYPTRATILKVVDTARYAGIDVGAIEVRPGGAIIVTDVKSLLTSKTEAEREFERWEAAGLL